MTNHAGAYNKMEVLTASSSKLVLLMYDGAIRFAEEGLRRIEKNDISGRGLYLGKSREIVIELMNVVDTKKGGEIGENLVRLYVYINTKLNIAISNGDEEIVREVIGLLSELREGWKGLIKEEEPASPSAVVNKAEASSEAFVGETSRIAIHA